MSYQKKIENKIRCPFEYGLQVFGGKWKARVLCLLNKYPALRFSEISQNMENIADGVLAATLKDLMEEELVTRTAYNEVPPRVEYSLTEKGLSVAPILKIICMWSGQYYTPTDELLSPCRDCEQNLARQQKRVKA